MRPHNTIVDPNDEFKVQAPQEEDVSVSESPEVEQPPYDGVAEPEDTTAQAAPSPSSAPSAAEQQRRFTEEQQKRNFQALRQQQEQYARELDLIRRENEELRRNLSRPEPKDDLGLSKDAIAEIGHVEKIVSKALAEQEARYQRELAQQRHRENERLFATNYKDYKTVLSEENLLQLQEQEPEIAATIAANPDNYSAKVAAYKWIKKLGIVEESDNSRRVQERLAQNAQRPRAPQTVTAKQGSPSLGAIASAQPGFAETITDDLAAKYRREMEEAISRL